MDNTYIIYKDTIDEALDDIDKFIQKMEMFTSKYPTYSYLIDIRENPDHLKKWIIKLNVRKDENVKVT